MPRDYDEYCGSNATVPFEEYMKIENKLENYINFVKEIKEKLFDDIQYDSLETITEIKSMFVEAEKEKIIK